MKGGIMIGAFMAIVCVFFIREASAEPVASAKSFDSTRWQWHATVRAAFNCRGFVRCTLPPEWFNVLQPGYADLRVIDERGEMVPYVINRPSSQDQRRVNVHSVQMLNRTYQDGAFTCATLDFGKPTLKEWLRVQTSGDTFRRRVKIEGSTDNASWATVADNLYLFKISGSARGKYELDTLQFPQNDFRYLRMTVYNAEDEQGKISILQVQTGEYEVKYGIPPRPLPVLHPSKQWRDEKTKSSYWTFDVGCTNVPLAGCSLTIPNEFFYRGCVLSGRDTDTVTTEERTEDGVRKIECEAPWFRMASTVIYRIKDSVSEKLSISELGPSHRTLLLEVYDGDDSALDIAEMALTYAVVDIIFDYKSEHSYMLWGGNASALAPKFDLASSTRELKTTDIPEVSLGPLVETEGYVGAKANSPQLAPWTERHGILLWVGLVMSVGVVGALIFRNFRKLQAQTGD